MTSKAKNALNFVDLLTPGNFKEARKWLSPDCEYSYDGETLTGKAIIKSFEQNHKRASKKLDSIKYLSGEARHIEGNRVFVFVQDKIYANGNEHIYTDCLIVTCNDNIGYGSVLKIKHEPIAEEQEKLQRFFKQNNIKL